MSPLLRHARALALIAAALPTLAGAAIASGEVSILAGVADRRAPLGPFALRMDNYVDVVDSVLNARVRPRRVAVPSHDTIDAVERRLAARTDADAVLATPDRGREDTLPVRRIARPPRLPLEPLIVRTTAAFTGTGAPAGAATWPPRTGRLAISAEDGSRIELDADTGDIASVDVTIASGSEVYRFREPWTTWAPLVLNDR